MRKAKVLLNGAVAGELTELSDGTFRFRYTDLWLANSTIPISLTLPTSKQEQSSATLFPFFYSLLPEGVNKQLVCRQLRLDESDHFGLLLATGGQDTIGAVTVLEIPE